MRKLPGWSAHHSYLAPPFGLKIQHFLKGILLDPRAENQTSGGVCHSVRFAITGRVGSRIVPIVTRNRLPRSALTTMSWETPSSRALEGVAVSSKPPLHRGWRQPKFPKTTSHNKSLWSPRFCPSKSAGKPALHWTCPGAATSLSGSTWGKVRVSCCAKRDHDRCVTCMKKGFHPQQDTNKEWSPIKSHFSHQFWIPGPIMSLWTPKTPYRNSHPSTRGTSATCPARAVHGGVSVERSTKAHGHHLCVWHGATVMVIILEIQWNIW